MKLEELKRLTQPLYVEGDPVGAERIEELKRLTSNGIRHEDEPNKIERLKAMVGLDERFGKLGVLPAADRKPTG